MNFLKSISLLALLANSVLAYGNPDVNAETQACLGVAISYNFTCDRARYGKKSDDMKNRYNCFCVNDGFIATFVHCQENQIPKERESHRAGTYETLLSYCISPRPDLTIEKIHQIYESFPLSEYKNASKITKKTPLSGPIFLPDAAVNNMLKTTLAFYFNLHHSDEYGGFMLAYMGAVMAIAMVFNFLKNFAPRFVKARQQNKLVMLCRKKFANSALFGYKHNTPVKCGPLNIINASIPTRVQVWVIIGYFAMFFIFMFIKYNIYEDDAWFPGKRRAFDRAIADRSGVLATTQLPLLYLLAGRNNFTLWLTGWSYDTMSTYHRWISRVMYLGVFIHSVAFTDFYIVNGNLAAYWSKIFMRWGIVGTVAGGLVCFFSFRHFRTKFYEFFMVCHWVFVIFFTIGCYYHLQPKGYSQWMYATIGVWALDRAVRLIRIVLSGLAKSDSISLSDDYFKMKIRYSNIWKIQPGQYVFIHYLKPFYGFWESHPFTCYQSPVPGEENLLVVIVKVWNGRTKYVNNYLKNHNNQATLPVFIDGPYGQHFPIAKNDTMIFISGGVGFTATYSYASKLKSHSEKKRVVFIWVTRKHEHVDMFKDELCNLVKDSAMDIQVYLTGESSLQKSDSLEEKVISDSDGQQVSEISENSSLESYDHISYTLGKPDFGQIINESVSQANGSVGIMVCGPPGINDTVRKVAVDNMDKGNKQVNVYVEAFNW